MTSRRVCVFCGASSGNSEKYSRLASELGAALAGAGLGLVFGAGGVGIMGAVSNAVLAAGGEAVGVIPQALFDREAGRRDLTELHVVATMHERKALMHELSAAFVVLPGGLGTMEEFFEVLTWAQLGFHDKPIIVLDVDGFYQPLVELLDHALASGFMAPADRRLVTVVDTADAVVELLTAPPS
ncbi:MAG: hypothetical protein JWO63_1121 [Frankiales bacterium]|jgi:uncharacterized protein (TIGR00730 family)|nr:hypothetical protein [Frankiales bacterium]